MSARDFPDFHSVRPEHRTIHDALLNWARVVRDSRAGTAPQPMFKYYRPERDNGYVPEPQIPTNTLEGWDMEDAVRTLPEKQREAIRWHYVFRRVPPQRVARYLSVPVIVLHDLVHDGRSMLKNRS